MTDKTEAMDNLIAQDADLIETLLEVGRDGVWKSGHNPATAHPMCVKAAYRIEALIASNEQWQVDYNEALLDNLQLQVDNAKLRERVKRVENNNRKLRGSKERVYAATDLRQPTQSDAEITEADCNVAEYIAGDRARDLDYQVVAYHRKWSALEERAKIVAWLMREEDDYPSGRYSGFAAIIREEIEAGEHLK